MNDLHIKESVTSFLFDVFHYTHILMMGGVFTLIILVLIITPKLYGEVNQYVNFTLT